MTPRRDDPEHDAWLRAALRHAPDADIAAPPAVSDTILRQARAATLAHAAPAAATRAAPPHAGLLEHLASFWAWLARPSVATGFASVMVATVVGMLWWDRPMDEAAMPAPAAAERMAQAPAAAAPTAAPAADAAPAGGAEAAPAGAAAPATAQAPTPAATAAELAPNAAPLPQRQRPVRATAPANTAAESREADPAPADIRRETAPRADISAKRQAQAANAAKAAATEPIEPAPPPMPKPLDDTATTSAQVATDAARSGGPSAQAGPMAAAPAARARSDSPASRPMAQATPASPSATPSPTGLTAPPARPTLAQDAAPPLAVARAERDAQARANTDPGRSAGASRMAAAPAAPTAALASRPQAAPWHELRQAIAAEPERWTWQRGDANLQPMTPALQAWLARLDDGAFAPTARQADAASAPLRLLRDGRLHSTVVLASEHLRLLPAETAQPALQWPLTPDGAAALRETLDAATR